MAITGRGRDTCAVDGARGRSADRDARAWPSWGRRWPTPAARLAELEPRTSEAAAGRGAALAELEQLVERTSQLGGAGRRVARGGGSGRCCGATDRQRALDAEARLAATRGPNWPAWTRPARRPQRGPGACRTGTRRTAARGGPRGRAALWRCRRRGLGGVGRPPSWSMTRRALALANRGGRLVVGDTAPPARRGATPAQARAVADAAQRTWWANSSTRCAVIRAASPHGCCVTRSGCLTSMARLPYKRHCRAGWRAVTLAGEVVSRQRSGGARRTGDDARAARRRDEAALQVAKLERSARSGAMRPKHVRASSPRHAGG